MELKHNDLTTLFTDIADAIREKTGSTDIIVADDFPETIESIETKIDYVNENITSIGDYAYYGMDNLKSVVFPNVESIGDYAFTECNNLQAITICGQNISVGSEIIPNNDGMVVYGLSGTELEIYATDNNIQFTPLDSFDISATEESGIIAIFTPYNDVLYINGSGEMLSWNGVPEPPPWYIDYVASIKKCVISDGISNIGKYAFLKCINLTHVVIPESVTTIGMCAFSGCTSLSNIIIPISVTDIELYAFSTCTKLTQINYSGTIEQWNAITFGENWNRDTGNYTIHCTNGDIPKS